MTSFSFPEFGEIIENKQQNKFPEFGEIIEEKTIPKEGFLTDLKEGAKGLGRVGLKTGAALAAAPAKSVGGMLNLLSMIGEKGRPGTKMIQSAAKYFSNLGEENQKFLKGKIEKLLGKPFGTGEEAITRYAENIAENVGQMPMKALLVPSAIGGFLGQTAEEVNAPSWMKTAAEIAPLAFPSFSKQLATTGKNKQLIEWGREMGMTEKELTPLIQSERKQGFLSKFAKKKGRAEKALKESKEALSNIYGKLREIPEANIAMNPSEINSFMKDMMPVIEDLPANIRDLVAKDAADLAKSGFTGSGLINFWQDINAAKQYQLGRLKGPITNALERFSPKLADDFRMTNNLYSKWATISKRLKPSVASELWSASEVPRFIYGVITGNFPVLSELLLENTAKKLATEMLVNPRFQNISKQMINALNKNKIGIANKLKDKMAKDLEDDFPEISNKLKKEDLLSHEHNP
jgi:hypothetical protein